MKNFQKMKIWKFFMMHSLMYLGTYYGVFELSAPLLGQNIELWPVYRYVQFQKNDFLYIPIFILIKLYPTDKQFSLSFH